jgi:hypothetical protein
MRARNRIAFAAALGVMTGNVPALAAGPAPLPPLPAPADDARAPPSTQTTQAAPPLEQPAPAVPSAPLSPAPPEVEYTRPPHGSESMAVEGVELRRAPRNALWLGARLGFLAYGGGLYVGDVNTGAVETTGNFIRPGAALEVDIGARLAGHYVPYAGVEFGLAAPGRRFNATDTRTDTVFYGVGFRYVAGDINSVAFVSDLSFGVRRFNASNSTGGWSAWGIELFRIGLGAEIRLAPRFTLSPLITISGGTLTDTSGNISFGPNQPDGQSGPPYNGDGSIPSYAQTTYYAVVLGCGAHFDLFGR